MKEQGTFKQNSFAPLLRYFNSHDKTVDEWIDGVEIYGLKYIEYDNSTRWHYHAVDESHRHSLWEVHLMQTGEQSYEVGEQSLTLNSGEFLLFSPDFTHCQILGEKHFSKFSMMMRLPMKSSLFSKQQFQLVIQRGYVKAETGAALKEILEYLFTHVDLTGNDSLSDLRACMILFFRMLSLRLQEVLGVEGEDQTANLKWERNGDAEFCERVVAYIKDNVSTILTLDDLSGVFFLSGRHINNKLKNYYGETYYVLANRIRADYAKELLCYSSLSIEEIAYNTGFSNAGNFIRFFKRVEGQSPNNFRRSFHECNRGVL